MALGPSALAAADAGDPATRLIALSALAQFDTASVVPALERATRDPDAGVRAAALAGLGFELIATDGTARNLRAAGLEVGEVAKVADADEGEQTVVDLVRDGRCDLVVNTPQGSGARADGYRIREAALVARVPCITTISGAAAAVHAIANARAETALSLQERIGAVT